MKRARVSALTLGLLLAWGSWSAADAAPTGSGPIALFDVRPIHANGQTDLEGLERAVALSRELRITLHEQGVDVLSAQNLKLNLPKNYRIKLFGCRESATCLRPSLSRLARLHVRYAIVGTLRTDTGVISLTGIRFAPYGEAKRLTVQAYGMSATMPDGSFEKLFEKPSEDSTSDDDDSDAPVADNGTTPSTNPSAAKPKSENGLSDDGGDAVESLTSDDTSTPSAPPELPDRFSLSGWARTSYELGLSGRGYRSAQPTTTDLTYDALIPRQQMLLRARFSAGRRFEAAVEGFAAWNIFEQLPKSSDVHFNLFNGQSARYALEAQVRDAYIALFFSKVDFRIGQQRVVWGHSDIFTPNDVLNARDLRDPVLSELEMTHLPTPLVRVNGYLPFGSLEVAYQPFLIPNRVDYFGSNWALIQPGSSLPLRYIGNQITTAGDPRAFNAVQELLTARTTPAFDLKEGSYSARFSYTLKQVDISHEYQYGYDSTPLYSISPALAQGLAMIDPRQPLPPALAAPVLASLVAGPPLLSQQYIRRHHIGTDFVTTVGSFVLRMDLTYDSERGFTRTDLSGTESPAFQAVAGVEYQTGEVGKSVEFEASWTHLFNDLGEPVLFNSQDTFAGGLVAQWLFADHFETELRVIAQAKPNSIIVRPQIGWKADAFTVRVGAVWLNGDPLGLGGYFSRNRSVYAMLKYAF